MSHSLLSQTLSTPSPAVMSGQQYMSNTSVGMPSMPSMMTNGSVRHPSLMTGTNILSQTLSQTLSADSHRRSLSPQLLLQQQQQQSSANHQSIPLSLGPTMTTPHTAGSPQTLSSTVPKTNGSSNSSASPSAPPAVTTTTTTNTRQQPVVVLDRQRLQELVQEVDPSEQLEDDVEDMLLTIADEFIESLVTSSTALARHRRSTTLDVRDVQLTLERNWHMWIPGFDGDDPEHQLRQRQHRRSLATEAHKQRMALIKKTLKKH